jgi:multiple sugar transport system permease protein
MWQAYEPRDARFWQYLYNTVYLMAGLPFGILGSLGLALLLNTKLPTGSGRQRLMLTGMMVACGLLSAVVACGVGGGDAALMAGLFWGIALLGVWCNVVSFRTLFYLPTFAAGVALMILWKALYNPTHGPINQVLRTLFELSGLGFGTPDWLASVDWAKPALIIMGLWIGIGGTNMLLYLAALTNVPEALREAAEVDGAGRWATFRHVVWPQLLPTTFFISIMSVIGGLQGGFEQAKIMTGGGPAGSTTTLSYYIYNKAFQDLDLGYAASISWVLFATIFLATAMNWKFGKGGEIDI